MRRPDRRNYTDELARELNRRERIPVKMVGTTNAGGNSNETDIRLLPLPIGDPGDVLTVVTNGDGDDVPAWEPPAASYTDEQAQDAVGGALVDGTGINFTYDDGANTITAEPIFGGTGSAGTVAHSDHTHAGGTTITVQEGDSDVDTAVSTLDFDASDFNVASSPAGEANISLNYGTGAGQPAEGNHTHAGATITVQEGDSDVDTAVTTLDFDASDFNVTSSPSGEANIALAYGTSAGTPAEGNHTHSTSVTFGLTVNMGDGTNVITSSEPACAVKVPFACTVTAWEVVSVDGTSGSITVIVERAPTATPATFTEISGSSDPNLSSATNNKDTAISGDWSDVTLDADDWLRFSVSGSPSSVKRIAVALTLTRTI